MNPSKPRIAIIGLSHESNTFVPEPTGLEHFRRSIFLLGEEIRERYSHAHHEVGGFFQALAEADIEAVPILLAHAVPWGKVSDEALDTIWGLIEEGLAKAGKLDGILAAPHGAGVNESRPDMDGWWLTQLRRKVGAEIPIIATMDPHGNLSSAMVESCDALIAYRENPHLDQRQRGIEAATLMVRTLRGDVQPVQAAVTPPIAINIERQLTCAEPILSVWRELEAVRATPGVLSASLVFGFPYADVPEMGSSFLVVTDNQPELAQREAARLADWLVANRERFRGEMISPQEALARAAAAPKPVGLLDMGDNLGGGAPGDDTGLARLCEESGFRTLLCIPDPESVQAAQAAGVGARVRLKIGGKLPMTTASPIDTEVTVLSLHDGKYTETKPRHGGKTGGDLGLTAIVRTDRGLTAMLSTYRGWGTSASAQPLLSCGIKPEEYDIIILKGVHAPVGGYAEVCPTLIRVNTPGVTTADMEALSYHHRRRPLFPFEPL